MIEMYDSPLTIITNNIASAIAKQTDDAVTCAINRTLGVEVDRDKLVAALHQDKERYEEAFMRGAMFKGFSHEELDYLSDLLQEHLYTLGRTDYEQNLHSEIMDKVNLWRETI